MNGEMLGRLTFLVILPFLVMALVGGAYYLAVRPRLTFREAMFRWWVFAVGFTYLLLSICGQFALRA